MIIYYSPGQETDKYQMNSSIKIIPKARDHILPNLQRASGRTSAWGNNQAVNPTFIHVVFLILAGSSV